ncbi:hypothetical protein CTAYLR_002326 [Chrysophaeum taylorii]|uniref:Glutaredoxin domain-containing protein n=1 Tax=Chrysophaeum taylorii TaxID=2483200 RepID=A0AAD7UPP1_9STRA|nr:hypothetical protein CTAYLR_002326 [Chrysophaeum taylorii]
MGSNNGKNSSEATEAVQKEIASEKVVVFSKTYCPYCANTKKLLSSSGVSAKIIEINLEPDQGKMTQAALLSLTSQRTVPNIFIGGKHVGGDDAIQNLARTGGLKPLLEEAGVPNII